MNGAVIPTETHISSLRFWGLDKGTDALVVKQLFKPSRITRKKMMGWCLIVNIQN